MALTGLQIYKFLPKTNCKKCGFPTCLAFSMKLAQKGADLSACPDISEEGKTALDSASRPPIQLVTVGSGDRRFQVGNETVLFRHEKTFLHEPPLVVRLRADAPKDETLALLEKVESYQVERVGMVMRFAGFALDGAGVDAAAFSEFVGTVKAKTTGALVLMSDDPAAMAAALEKVGKDTPLVYAASAVAAPEMAKLAVKHKCPLAVGCPDGTVDDLAALVEGVTALGVVEVVVDPAGRSLGESLNAETLIRRAALRKNYRPLGYPTISFAGANAASADEEVMAAAQSICKYAGIVVLDHFSPEAAYTLFTLRQNVYTDPQKPIQVSPGVYPIREAGPTSPVIVTTNFSLTYFSVLGEIENSGVPTWLLIADSEGLSVLTAWAAGKFDAEKIAKSVKQHGLAEKLTEKRIILPGLVASLSGELEDELAGWKVLVGPREAVDLPGYMRRFA